MVNINVCKPTVHVLIIYYIKRLFKISLACANVLFEALGLNNHELEGGTIPEFNSNSTRWTIAKYIKLQNAKERI